MTEAINSPGAVGPRVRRVLLELAFVAILGSLIAYAYAPSLRHAPRADQWCLLVDTRHHHNFTDLLRHCYSYNRTRGTCPGDTDLFRPILFGLLALEKWLFGGDFVL